ncbi:MAG: hypothetical protein RL662_1721 [Bacteroidota bacterium]|jgi:ribosomal-protein-serine acetyltransferase
MIEVSETLLLKRISLSHVDAIFETIDSERAYLRQWLPFVDTTLGVHDTFSYVQGVIEQNEPQYSIFKENRFVGILGFKHIDAPNRKAEIGYWLSQKVQGRGIMIRAINELLLKSFNDWGLHKVQIKIAVDNLRSRRIPEKIGFSLEGIERAGELLVDNKFTDLAVYGLLKTEFKI